MKKKIGNATKRNRIKRKLKAIVFKLLKIKGAINYNYTYIVFGKTKAYTEKHSVLLLEMNKKFLKTLNKKMSKKIISFIINIIKFYRFLISPLLGNNKCRYLPTCSEYFIESLKAHGI